MGDVDTQLFFLNHIKFITTATLQGLLEFLATSSSAGFVPHLRNFTSCILQRFVWSQHSCQEIPLCSCWPVQEPQELQHIWPSSGVSRLQSAYFSLQLLPYAWTLGAPSLKPFSWNYWRLQSPASQNGTSWDAREILIFKEPIKSSVPSVFLFHLTSWSQKCFCFPFLTNIRGVVSFLTVLNHKGPPL